MHKPNKQTLVVPLAAMELLRTLPVQSLNGFGGKLGTTLVDEHGIGLLGELRSFQTVQVVYLYAYVVCTATHNKYEHMLLCCS